jgi:hypothetical protein
MILDTPLPAWNDDGFLEALLGLEQGCRKIQLLLSRPALEPLDITPDSWLDFLLGLDVATQRIPELIEVVAAQAVPADAKPELPELDTLLR